MTEQEAIDVIRREVEGDAGFVAHIERTGVILAEHVTSFFEALDALALYWRDRHEVPKRDVLPLVDVWARIEATTHLHETSEEQIEDLAIEVYTHIANVLSEASDPHTEEGARRIIEEQFTSTAGMPYALRMSLGPNDGFVAESLTALQTLESAWRDRDAIPRRLAEVMFDIRYAVNSTAGLYQGRVAEIEAIGDALGAAVIKCLS